MIYSIAVDLGATSGRVILSCYDKKSVSLETIYRFSNKIKEENGHFYWDIWYLFDEIKKGLKLVGKKGVHVSSIGFDTWGVDFGLIDQDGLLICNPISYRDETTLKIIDEVHEIISIERMYEITGIMPRYYNTLYRLYYYNKFNASTFNLTDKILFMPNLLNYLFSGVAKNEHTISSTSQLIDAESSLYSKEIIGRLGLKENMFPEIIEAGNMLAYVKTDIIEECGLNLGVEVASVPGHDTACAVCTQTNATNSAFVILGTWTLVGAELDEPIKTKEAMSYGFSNEGNPFDKIRLLKNITGMWVLNQLKKCYEEENGDISFDKLTRIAIKNSKVDYMIDIQDQRFNNPSNMYQEVNNYLLETYKVKTISFSEIIAAIFNGMADAVVQTIKEIESMDIRVETINVLGGGVKNKHLISLIRERSGKDINVGPIEASALGNALMQLVALKEIKSLEELRIIATRSEADC